MSRALDLVKITIHRIVLSIILAAFSVFSNAQSATANDVNQVEGEQQSGTKKTLSQEEVKAAIERVLYSADGTCQLAKLKLPKDLTKAPYFSGIQSSDVSVKGDQSNAKPEPAIVFRNSVQIPIEALHKRGLSLVEKTQARSGNSLFSLIPEHKCWTTYVYLFEIADPTLPKIIETNKDDDVFASTQKSRLNSAQVAMTHWILRPQFNSERTRLFWSLNFYMSTMDYSTIGLPTQIAFSSGSNLADPWSEVGIVQIKENRAALIYTKLRYDFEEQGVKVLTAAVHDSLTGISFDLASYTPDQFLKVGRIEDVLYGPAFSRNVQTSRLSSPMAAAIQRIEDERSDRLVGVVVQKLPLILTVVMSLVLGVSLNRGKKKTESGENERS